MLKTSAGSFCYNECCDNIKLKVNLFLKFAVYDIFDISVKHDEWDKKGAKKNITTEHLREVESKRKTERGREGGKWKKSMDNLEAEEKQGNEIYCKLSSRIYVYSSRGCLLT